MVVNVGKDNDGRVKVGKGEAEAADIEVEATLLVKDGIFGARAERQTVIKICGYKCSTKKLTSPGFFNNCGLRTNTTFNYSWNILKNDLWLTWVTQSHQPSDTIGTDVTISADFPSPKLGVEILDVKPKFSAQPVPAFPLMPEFRKLLLVVAGTAKGSPLSTVDFAAEKPKETAAKKRRLSMVVCVNGSARMHHKLSIKSITFRNCHGLESTVTKNISSVTDLTFLHRLVDFTTTLLGNTTSNAFLLTWFICNPAFATRPWLQIHFKARSNRESAK